MEKLEMHTLELNVNHRGSVSLFILSTFFCPSLVHKPPKEQQKHAALLKLCHYVATHVLQWRGMSHRRLWKQTHTHTYICSFDGRTTDTGSRRFQGQRNLIMSNIQGLTVVNTATFLHSLWDVYLAWPFLNLSWQLRSSEAPVSFQLKPIHWKYRGKPADP